MIIVEREHYMILESLDSCYFARARARVRARSFALSRFLLEVSGSGTGTEKLHFITILSIYSDLLRKNQIMLPR